LQHKNLGWYSEKKGFSEKDLFKINKYLFLLRELDGKPFNKRMKGKTRKVLVNCLECGKVRNIRLVDFLNSKRGYLCRPCSRNGKRNPSKLLYVREKIKEAMKTKDMSYLTPEFRKKFSESRKGSGNPMYGRKQSKRERILKSITHKKKFKDLEYCKEFGQRFHTYPNKPEIIVINICKELKLPFKYVGNGKEWINGKNPDFIHEDEKKVIEVFGDYWHSREHTGIDECIHMKERKELFERRGYECMIIWEKELQNIEKVRRRIKLFGGCIND